MAKGEYLGEFEQTVLLALARLGDEAYGVTMRMEIEERTGRQVSIGAIYPTLDRLEAKGFVSSYLGDPTPERGGRCKRYFKLTPAGVRALIRSREVLARMWEGLQLKPGMRLTF
jgi:DNA-binding PadR family transcriptional regulator